MYSRRRCLKYRGCLKCAAKVQEDGDVGEYLKCGMLQQLQCCLEQFSCQLIIVSGEKKVTLRAFGKVVVAIAQEESISARALLKAKPFDVTYSEGNVIQSIKRRV